MRPGLGIALGVRIGPRPSSGGSAAAFTHSRTVTANNSGNAAKTDYPVNVVLSSSNFDFTHTQSDGRDIQFKDAGGTVLSHWIESWDAAGQSASIWVKAPSLPSNASVTLTMLYGSATATSTSDIHGTFIFGDDFTNLDRLIGFPDKTYPARTGVFDIVFGNFRKIASLGAAGAWNETLREQAQVVYDPADPDPNKRFKFYYTGQTLPSDTGARHVGLSYSPDLQTWTEYAGNPVIGNGADPNRGEDPYIVRNIDGSAYRDPGGLLHMFSEDQAQQDMLHYTSPDGITWTADPANPVLHRGAGGSFDDAIVASPIVVHLGGDNSFYMVYEARSSVSDPSDTIGNANESGAGASASTLMGQSWTKLGKFHYGDVPDELILDSANGKWWYLWHNTGGSLGRSFTTNLNPLTWTLGDFSEPTPSSGFWPQSGGSSYMGAPAHVEGSEFGKSFVVNDQTDSQMYLCEVIGSDYWLFERISAAAAVSPRLAAIEPDKAASGTLVLDPSLDTSAGGNVLFAYTRQLSLTSDFQIIMRRKAENGPTDNRYAQIGFGAGNPTALAGNNAINYTPDGYFFLSTSPGTAGGLQVRKYAGSTETTLATGTLTEAEATNYNRHEISYLSNGALRYALNGVQKVAATDATHVSVAKQVVISQGRNSSVAGAKQTVDWIAVRKWDGQDPAITVGAEA